MAAAKKKPSKNPVVKPMPVPSGRGSAGRQPEWKGALPPRRGEMGIPETPEMMGQKPLPAQYARAKNLTPPNATGIKKQAVKKQQAKGKSGIYW